MEHLEQWSIDLLVVVEVGGSDGAGVASYSQEGCVEGLPDRVDVLEALEGCRACHRVLHSTPQQQSILILIKIFASQG